MVIFQLIKWLVHLQNSADLLYKLTSAGVRRYQVQVYTDANHSMNAGRANVEIYLLIKKFLFQAFRWKA